MIPLRDLWGIYKDLGFRGLGFRVSGLEQGSSVGSKADLQTQASLPMDL